MLSLQELVYQRKNTKNCTFLNKSCPKSTLSYTTQNEIIRAWMASKGGVKPQATYWEHSQSDKDAFLMDFVEKCLKTMITHRYNLAHKLLENQDLIPIVDIDR